MRRAVDGQSFSRDCWQIEPEGLIGSDTQWLLDDEGTNEEFVVRLPPTVSEAAASSRWGYRQNFRTGISETAGRDLMAPLRFHVPSAWYRTAT